jgi:hypothetical protein
MAFWIKTAASLEPNLRAVWSRKRGCVELAEGDVIALHLVVARLKEAGVGVRFYGRLRRWDGTSPVWTLLARERH